MSPHSATVVAVAVFALLCAALTILVVWRKDLPPGKRAALAALRLMFLVLLAAAYVRPGIAFRRLAGPPGPAVVLLDNSRSMTLFAAESLWHAVVRPAVEQAQASVVLFGDSVRRLDRNAAPDFTDRRSFLPFAGTVHPSLAAARKVLVVSDGNWSNARIPAALFADKDVAYLPLTHTGPRPWLAVAALDERVVTVTGRDSGIQVVVWGNVPKAAQIEVLCLRQEKVVSRITRRVGSGFFRDTVTLPLSGGSPGRNLCRIVAQSDTLTAACHVLQTVIPSELRAAVRCAVPSLDSRFLSRALRRVGGWRLDTTQAPHLLVLFDWQDADQSAMARIALGGVVLLAGVLPCPADTLYAAGPCRFVVAPSGDHRLEPIAISSVPAPHAVLTCPHGADPGRTLLALECAAKMKADTVALLSAKNIRGRTVLILAARGFWRWDFRTQLLEETRGVEHPFCRYVLALARDLVIANLSDNLLALPQSSSPNESRGTPMVLLLPGGNLWAQPAEIRLTLYRTAGDTVFDTSFTVAPSVTPRAEVVLPVCAAGLYTYSVSLRRRDGPTLTYADTLRVGPDRTELDVTGQNVTLLEQIARPVAPGSASDIAAVLESHGSDDARQTVTSTLRIEHTWGLLAAMLFVLTLEWVLRRVWLED